MDSMMRVNYGAVLAGMGVNIVLGFLWYGPLFGKAWAGEMGFPEDMKPEPKVMRRAMVLMAAGAFLMNFVLAHSVKTWDPSVMNFLEGSTSVSDGVYAAFFAWLGFIVPLLFGDVSWENKSWKLFGINAAYYFVSLQAAGMILAYWR